MNLVRRSPMSHRLCGPWHGSAAIVVMSIALVGKYINLNEIDNWCVPRLQAVHINFYLSDQRYFYFTCLDTVRHDMA